MRLSISAKIFLGFATVLALFGTVATFGVLTLRRMGDELRLASRGYLQLRLDVSELGTSLKVLVEQMNRGNDSQRVPRWAKAAIDDLRRVRLTQQVPGVLNDLRELEVLRAPPEDKNFLREMRSRVEKIATGFRENEELFDEVYGPVEAGGDAPINDRLELSDETRAAAESLFRREQQIKRDVGELAAALRSHAKEAAIRLEDEESRTLWIAAILALVAVGVALLVMMLSTRTLRPLRQLAERAKEIARGDYRKRVADSTSDEISALGREFNAMASALEEREQRLIRSERLAAVGQIAAQITHEVRNPLSSIGLNAELLEEELGQPERVEQARNLVRSIVSEVDRLTEITEGYLRFARLPRPVLVVEDLGAIVSERLTFMRSELLARNVSVELQIDPDLPAVAADENQMRQALLNLLRNAADAMPQGGKLSVYAARSRSSRPGEPSSVELRISDTGQGIKTENLTRIFDPFFSTKEGGTGLGLALTHQIIHEHGGRIDAISQLGQGTTFTIVLPTATPSHSVTGQMPLVASVSKG